MKFFEVEKIELETEIETSCWIRYIRSSKTVTFLQCYDGTTDMDIQLVVDKDQMIDLQRGDYIYVKAIKIKSRGTQEFELKIKQIKILSHPKHFPLAKIDSSTEFLREIPQYRTKTVDISSILKLRSKIELLISQYYDQKHFLKVTPPLITPSDCEGAGETFELDKEFFQKPAFLTVSSQMYLESLVRSFSQVYCFAPAFRADPSLSSRHLAEFWMLEVEIITDDVDEVIKESLDLIRFIGESLLLYKDLLIQIDKQLPLKIEEKIKSKFKILTYKEATSILGKPILGAKEEKELMILLDSSIVLKDFPVEFKPFYMKRDRDITKSFDILVKGVGEVVGGSLREADDQVLKQRMTDSLIKSLDWYLDIRTVDKIYTGGFGLGFERILMYYLEVDSIKEIAIFPRYYGKMQF